MGWTVNRSSAVKTASVNLTIWNSECRLGWKEQSFALYKNGQAWECLFLEGLGPLYNKLEREKRDGVFDSARFNMKGNGN